MKDHEVNCPRLQFWDAGEHEAPCYCDQGSMRPDLDAIKGQLHRGHLEPLGVHRVIAYARALERVARAARLIAGSPDDYMGKGELREALAALNAEWKGGA